MRAKVRLLVRQTGKLDLISNKGSMLGEEQKVKI